MASVAKQDFGSCYDELTLHVTDEHFFLQPPNHDVLQINRLNQEVKVRLALLDFFKN